MIMMTLRDFRLHENLTQNPGKLINSDDLRDDFRPVLRKENHYLCTVLFLKHHSQEKCAGFHNY